MHLDRGRLLFIELSLKLALLPFFYYPFPILCVSIMGTVLGKKGKLPGFHVADSSVVVANHSLRPHLHKCTF